MSKSGLDLTDSVKSGMDFFLTVGEIQERGQI
jgi:hypothetical protein